MAQYDIDLRDYWRIVRKRKTVIIISMATMFVFSFIFANYKQRTAVDYYSSYATIRIDSAQSTGGGMMSMYGVDSSEDISTEIQTITSFPVMMNVALMVGALPDSLKGRSQDEKESIVESDSEMLAIVNSIISQVNPEQLEYSSAININTITQDPVTSRDLAQYVVEAYQENRRINNNLQVTRTIEYLHVRVNEIEAKMDSIQKEIETYSPQYDTSIPLFSDQALAADMMRMYQNIDNLDLKIHSTEMMIDLLEKAGVVDDSMLSNTFAESEGGVFRQKYTELLSLKANKTELVNYLTDAHPDVKAVEAKIEKAKQDLVDQLKGNVKAFRVQQENYQAGLVSRRERYSEVTSQNDQLGRLMEQKKISVDQYYQVMSQLQEVEIKKSENVDEITVIKPAVINRTPINAVTPVAASSFIGLFLGMVIGLVAAFIFEALDTSIGTIEDVESYMNVSVIGLIPQIEKDDLKENLSASKLAKKMNYEVPEEHAMLVIQYAPKSVLAESYRALRTNIQFISYEQEASVLLFTSSSPSEGKTTTIVNMSLTMAQSGNRVLLVDADLRKPRINRVFGLETENGLSEILLGKRDWRECVKTVTDIITGDLGMNDLILTPGIDNMNIITCGTIPPNPSELLNSDSMDVFIKEVREEYDMVLFDCPPILPATDPAVLARKVDGVVLVYAVGRISRGALKRAKAQIDNVKARVIGVVLNGMRSELSVDFQDYKKTVYYAYEEEEDKEESTGVKKFVDDLISRFK